MLDFINKIKNNQSVSFPETIAHIDENYTFIRLFDLNTGGIDIKSARNQITVFS